MQHHNPVLVYGTYGFCCFIFLAASAFSQDDAKGAKEHPLFPNRMPGYYIHQYKELEFDAHSFKGDKKETNVEGHKYYISYRIKRNEERKSEIEVRRNYSNAFTKIGGKVLFDRGNYLTMKQEKADAEVWAELWTAGDKRGCHWYHITIVEKGEMKQTITANDMLDALNKDGFIALDIHFDTGKSTIKEESRALIEQIAALMKGNSGLNVSVEGHTDNVGGAAMNKTLSNERAAAVVAAIVVQGIVASRLSSVGYGMEKPVADNRTEEGRAKNRRVELVKK